MSRIGDGGGIELVLILRVGDRQGIAVRINHLVEAPPEHLAGALDLRGGRPAEEIARARFVADLPAGRAGVRELQEQTFILRSVGAVGNLDELGGHALEHKAEGI